MRFEAMSAARDGGGSVPGLRTATNRAGCATAPTVGREADVDALTARLRSDGYEVLEGPRRTGDGYYESVVLDPDGNRLELAAAR
jgi:lactoylglutathione lyase